MNINCSSRHHHQWQRQTTRTTTTTLMWLQWLCIFNAHPLFTVNSNRFISLSLELPFWGCGCPGGTQWSNAWRFDFQSQASQSDAIVTLECESKSQGKYGNLKASVIFLVQDHLFVLPSFSSFAALLCSGRAMQGPLLEGHCCCAESSTSESGLMSAGYEWINYYFLRASFYCGWIFVAVVDVILEPRRDINYNMPLALILIGIDIIMTTVECTEVVDVFPFLFLSSQVLNRWE